jgi:hypothetical protein
MVVQIPWVARPPHRPIRADPAEENLMSRPACLDDLQRLDIRKLVREGYLLDDGQRRWLGWRVGGTMIGSMVITAAMDSLALVGHVDGRTVSATVELTDAELTFGRRRYFECPRCERRCSVLYPSLGVVCSDCSGLTWLTHVMAKEARKTDKLHRARAALNMDANGHTVKPPGMHTSTWARLWQRYWAIAEEVANEAVAA